MPHWLFKSIVIWLTTNITANSFDNYFFFKIITKIACESHTSLQYATDSGLLQDLLSDLHSDDVLIQLNAAEMVTNLAMCHHGLTYLTQQGIVDKMESMMVQAEGDPLQAFLLPGRYKCYNLVGAWYLIIGTLLNFKVITVLIPCGT